MRYASMWYYKWVLCIWSTQQYHRLSLIWMRTKNKDSWLVSMENVIVLPGWKQLATAASEKTVDIHGFITITRSISLISMCLLLSVGRYLWYPCVYYYDWVDISDIYVFITITGSISLISMCLLLSLGRYLWYSCVYYYHWVDISYIHVFITITGSSEISTQW
jgi:hypothetical protein